MLRRLATPLLVLPTALALTFAASAAAGTYSVDVCSQAAPGGDGLSKADESSVRMVTRLCGAAGNAPGTVVQEASPTVQEGVQGAQSWSLTAPDGTRIGSATMKRTFSIGKAWERMRWKLLVGPDRGEEVLEEASELNLPPNGPREDTKTHLVNSTKLTGRLACTIAQCERAILSVVLQDMNVLMEDLVAPTVTAGGPLLAGGTMSGTKQISFEARDRGAGIVAVSLLLDGKAVAQVTDANGGKCDGTYTLLAPCKLALDSSIAFDTRSVPDGEHEVQLRVEDAGQESGVSTPVQVKIDNAPRPGGGGGAGGGPTPAPAGRDTMAPSLDRVSLSRTRFRPGKGAVLRFASSEAEQLQVQFQTAAGKTLGSLTQPIASAGPGRLAVRGRIGRKALRPGRYRLTVTVRDVAGNASAPRRLAFTILPR